MVDNIGKIQDSPSYYDVDYGIASPRLTTGLTAVVTGSANYHGFTLIAGGTEQAKAVIYDSVATASGNVVDIVLVGSDSHRDSRDVKVKARLGLYVEMSGTGAEGVVFYAPSG